MFSLGDTGSYKACAWCMFQGQYCKHLSKMVYADNRCFLPIEHELRKDQHNFPEHSVLFPLDENVPQSVIEWFDSFARSHRTTRELLLVSALASTSALIGKTTLDLRRKRKLVLHCRGAIRVRKITRVPSQVYWSDCGTLGS